MPKPTKPYTVRPGDWMARIAQEHGTSVGEIWTHPDNAEHRRKRGTPDELYSGDVLNIPIETAPGSLELPASLGIPGPGLHLMLPRIGAILPVHELTVVEQLSTPTRTSLLASAPTLLGEHPRALIGQPAWVVVHNATDLLVSLAIVRRVEVDTRRAAGGVVGLRISAVSNLGLLAMRYRSRIFHDKALDQIIAQCLRDVGIKPAVILQNTYPTRTYCTQFRQSDLTFVRRLLAESQSFLIDACFAHFANVDDATAWITSPEEAATRSVRRCTLADHPDTFEPLDPGDPSYAPPLVQRGDSTQGVFGIRRTDALVSTRRQYTARDPRHPAYDIGAVDTADPASTDYRVYELTDPGFVLEQFEHGLTHIEPHADFGRDRNRLRFEAARAQSTRYLGTTNIPRLRVGSRLQLDEALSYPIGVNAVAVRRVRHRWRAGAGAGDVSYDNSFVAGPTDAAVFPSAPRRRAVPPCTARVVGPRDGHPHVDADGRVRVEFPWARASDNPNTATCWLRVSQPWAGAGFGAQFLPHGGTEVVVQFLDGHPDRPFVAGSLHDATHRPPYSLPEQQDHTGVRSRSLGDESGYNEVVLIDTPGNETVRVRSQRDLVTHAGRNESRYTRNHRTTEVQGDDALHVVGDRRTLVDGDRLSTVTGTDTTRIGENELRAVAGTRELDVRGSLEVRVAADHNQSVEGNDYLHCQGSRTETVESGKATFVGTTDQPTQYITQVAGDRLIDVTNLMDLRAGSTLSLSVGGTSLVVSSSKITMVAGGSSLELGERGLLVSASGAFSVGAGDVAIKADASVALASGAGASLGLNAEAHLDGAQVLLNSPTEASTTPPKAEVPTLTTIKLVGENGEPLAHHPFVLIRDDGSRLRLRTDSDGTTRIPLADEAQLQLLHGEMLPV